VNRIYSLKDVYTRESIKSSLCTYKRKFIKWRALDSLDKMN
jgi:hypothetical protein